MTAPEYHQRRVSDDPEHNQSLPDEDRIANLEYDAVGQWMVLGRVVEQNDKYRAYLDKKIEAEEENKKFWKKQRELLVSAGIKGAIVVFVGALLYAFSLWVKTF